jgi:hypothetical protein
MRVIVCGNKEVVVSLTPEEFMKLTGTNIGDYYGNHGAAPDSLPGRQYDLASMMKAMDEMKLAAEVKNTVCASLDRIKEQLQRAYFPVADFADVKAKEVKAKKP